MSNKIIWEALRFDEDEKEEDAANEGDFSDGFVELSNESSQYIYTKGGVLPLSFYEVDIHGFNFWLAHTNFSITTPVAYKIERVDGVESLDVVSRYRFRIAIGKAFDATDVKRNIERVLDAELNFNKAEVIVDLKTYNKISKLKTKLDNMSTFWIIYTCNGKLKHLKFENKISFIEKLNLIKSNIGESDIVLTHSGKLTLSKGV